MTQTALILGATGRFGRNMNEALQAAGWNTRAFNRENDMLKTAAQSADIIVYGWNPPFNKWDTQCLGQLQQVIDAARASGSTILFPGNIYPYGTEMPPLLTETTPHSATNTLGKIRTTMESMLQASGVKTIILRAGDFIDTEANGNWFDMIITKNTHKNGKISYPGNPDIPHAWAYLPDYARALTALADKRDTLPAFTALNFEGYTLSGSELAERLNANVQRMNWLPIHIARLFWPMAKHLLEMRYQWNTPHQIDGSTLQSLLPDFRTTPVNIALQSAVSFEINPNQPMVRTRATI